MKERVAYIILVAFGTLLAISTASCNAPWWTGHDNGEAYEAYMEAMEEYIEENGLELNMYGYRR